MATQIFPRKAPDEVLTYQLDWADRLGDGGTISGSAWTAPAGLTINSQSYADTHTVVTVSGGEDGVTYFLVNEITATGGNTMTETVQLLVASVDQGLVTLNQVKTALRIDTDADDAILSIYIAAASRTVMNYLGSVAETLLDLDSSGKLSSEAVIPEDVTVATIYMVGHFYRAMDSNPEEAFTYGRVPLPVSSLLYHYRVPVVA